MKEVAWIEVERKIFQFKIGTEYSVEFDLLELWQENIHSQEEENVFFCHTHPFEDKPHISEQDKECIKAINLMFGKEFIYDFVIVGNKEFVVYNRFMDQVDTGTNIHVDNIMIGISKCV
jgi:hypothetical protein